MCNDQKMLKQQLKNSKKAKYEMGNFCEQYGLPPISPFRQKGKHAKKHDNHIKDINIKDILLKLMLFMITRNTFIKNMIDRNMVKENASIVVNLGILVKNVNKNLEI